MKELFVRFIKEEDGMGTVEMVVIVAVLLGIALIFRRKIFDFVNTILNNIFGKGDMPGVIDDPTQNPAP